MPRCCYYWEELEIELLRAFGPAGFIPGNDYYFLVSTGWKLGTLFY